MTDVELLIRAIKPDWNIVQSLLHDDWWFAHDRKDPPNGVYVIIVDNQLLCRPPQKFESVEPTRINLGDPNLVDLFIALIRKHMDSSP